jgi:nitroreductase
LAAPVSTAEAVLPASRRMHAASSLEGAEEVTEWRAGGRREGRRGAGPASLPPSPPIEAVIRRRRSAGAFTTAGISREELAILLRVASTPVGTDYGGGCVTPYLAVHAVEHLAPGTYAVPDGATMVALRHGSVRAAAAAAALGQRPAGSSAVNLYLLADLPAVLSRLGNRGYRAAQLTGGLLAGRLYLAAYALGRGATGLTFYDDLLIEMLMPAGGDRSVMFLLAVGSPPPAAVPA